MTCLKISSGQSSSCGVYPKVFVVVSLLFQLVSGQASLGGLGTGLLHQTNLHTGGLVFANPDGSGPQANNLAAAIYGVAVPPGFSQFSASENYFSANPYTGGSGGTNPLDLLVGTGLHGGSDSGGGPAFGSSSDFSAGVLFPSDVILHTSSSFHIPQFQIPQYDFPSLLKRFGAFGNQFQLYFNHAAKDADIIYGSQGTHIVEAPSTRQKSHKDSEKFRPSPKDLTTSGATDNKDQIPAKFHHKKKGQQNTHFPSAHPRQPTHYNQIQKMPASLKHP